MWAIDLLEGRVLLSAVYDPETGMLTVNGTDAGETIIVELNFGAGGALSEIRTHVGAVSQVFSQPATFPEKLIINAGGGDDNVHVFSSGADPYWNLPTLSVEAYGGDGNDTIKVDFGVGASIHGGAGNDTLMGNYTNDLLVGGSGNDELVGHEGNDALIGGDGNDELYGNEGDDSLDGGAGNDLLRGQADNDMLKGGAGDDILDGDRGVDTANYNDGAHYGNLRISIGDGANDGYVIDAEKDDVTGETENLIGTDGDDTLIGNSANNSIRGGGGHDLIMGYSGDDRLEGSYWPDKIYGGRGNDTLIGYGGNDSLYGDRGDDYLDGGSGNDLVDGGAGRDWFVEGFYDSATGDLPTLAGTLKHRGVTDSGPNRWVLQTGDLNQDADQLLLDVSAVQARANTLDGRFVTVTGTVENRLNEDSLSVRVLVVKTIAKGGR